MGKRADLRRELVEATRDYEAWAARRAPVVPADLRLKHRRMAEGPFPFFRATFYRWVELWRRLGGEARDAPRVLAVGDLHVENFGTWRDAEGRLVWGVNDFDEAHPGPYTLDLARLAASARLAGAEGHLALGLSEACEAILEGYLAGLRSGGEPIVLADQHPWLREIAVASARDPARFWARITALRPCRDTLPSGVSAALARLFPARGLPCRWLARVAGLGSLGRVRVLALAWYRGAWTAREAKALVPSALARGSCGEGRCWVGEALRRSVRAPDPFAGVLGWWSLRRLAPDCARVELTDLPARRDEAQLLCNMGREAANVHLGSRGARSRILRHLTRQRPGWLRALARDLADATEAEAAAWRSHQLRGGH